MATEVDDLSNLPVLKENIILDLLRTRYFKEKYYVSTISLFYCMLENFVLSISEIYNLFLKKNKKGCITNAHTYLGVSVTYSLLMT